MSIKRDLPEVVALRQKIEAKFGRTPAVHEDFVDLREAILQEINERISETTLERVWGYSTRGYDNISLRIMNLLCLYAGFESWDSFCRHLKEAGAVESDVFDMESVTVDELLPGDRLRIGWQPDRVCTIRYLGEGRFVAEEAINSKMHPGDTFSCLQLQLGIPAYLENLTSSTGEIYGKRYGVGLKHGLSILQKLDNGV